MDSFTSLLVTNTAILSNQTTEVSIDNTSSNTEIRPFSLIEPDVVQLVDTEGAARSRQGFTGFIHNIYPDFKEDVEDSGSKNGLHEETCDNIDVESLNEYEVVLTSGLPTPPTYPQSQFYGQSTIREDESEEEEEELPIQLGGAYIDSDPALPKVCISRTVHKLTSHSSIFSQDIDELDPLEVCPRNEEKRSIRGNHSISHSQCSLSSGENSSAGGFGERPVRSERCNFEGFASHEGLEWKGRIGLDRYHVPLLQRMQDQANGNFVGLDPDVEIPHDFSDKSRPIKTIAFQDRSPNSTESARRVVIESFQRQFKNLKMKERELEMAYRAQKRELQRELENVERHQMEFLAGNRGCGSEDGNIQPKIKRRRLVRGSRRGSQSDNLSSVGPDGGNFDGGREEVRRGRRQHYSSGASSRVLRSQAKENERRRHLQYFSLKASPKTPYMRRVQKLFTVKSLNRSSSRKGSESSDEAGEDEEERGDDDY